MLNWEVTAAGGCWALSRGMVVIGEADSTGEGVLLPLPEAPPLSPSQSSFDDRTEACKSGSSGNCGNALSLLLQIIPTDPEAAPVATTAVAVGPDVKLADRAGRAMADRGEGETGTADRGDEPLPPEGLLGPNEVCKNLGTSLPNSLEDRRPDFAAADDAAVIAATPAAGAGVGGDDDSTAPLLMASSWVSEEDEGVILLRRSGLEVGGDVPVNARSCADFWGGGGGDVRVRSARAVVSIASGTWR